MSEHLDPAPVTDPGTRVPVRPGAPGWLRTTVALGRRLDAQPWSPTSVGERAWNALYERRKRAAAADPRWATIEKRRDTGRPGLKVLRSDDLTWGDFETQRAIEDDLVPDPWWWPAAQVAKRTRFAALAADLVAAVDRVRRGWDSTDAYNLSTSLPVRIGEQLAWLADHLHGWPGEHNGYPTPEEWEDDLRRHALVLTTDGYGTPGAHDALLDAWSTARRTSDASRDPDDEAATEVAWQRLRDAERDARDAVTASMRWVADHIHLLWD